MELKNFLSQTGVNPIWQAKKSYGSSFHLDMGEKWFWKNPRNGKEVSKGRIRLRVLYCKWSIKINNKMLCHSESTDTEIDNTLELFIGSLLKDIIKVSETELHLHFSVEPVIILDNNDGTYEDDSDFFTLFIKDYSISFSQKTGFRTVHSPDL